MGAPLMLIDLSNNNSGVDFTTLKSSGVYGVWLKVSEGLTFADSTYQSRRDSALSAGLRVGGYHFAQPGSNDATDQAEWFAHHLGKVGRKDLRPFLDLETSGQLTLAAQVEAWARTWTVATRRITGVGPLFYSFQSYIEGLQLSRPIGYGLLLAVYGRNDGVDHGATAPLPWRRFVAHQFADDCTVRGATSKVDGWHASRGRPLLAHPWLGVA